jgi:putative DNA primase/helicase
MELYFINEELEETERDLYLNAREIEKVTDNELLNYALHYSKAGYPVLPLHNLVVKNGITQCSCKDGIECTKSAKHPRTRHGSLDATREESQIFDWWQHYPNANIGLLTGKEAGIFILDVDVKDGGEFSLDELQDIYRTDIKAFGREYEPLPATLTTITGSGGRHLYFKHLMDFGIKGTASKIASGLDIRGENNYIIAPPSKHISGNRYKWFGVDIPIEDAPIWLKYEIVKADERQQIVSCNFSNSTQKVKDEIIGEGQRNDYLFRQVCGLVNSFPEDEVLRRALQINEERFSEPLEVKEVERIVKAAWKRYAESNNKNLGLKKEVLFLGR